MRLPARHQRNTVRYMECKKHRHICVTLLREELIYDIQFEAWKISKTHIDDKTMQAEAHVNMEADDWIERQIQSAIDRIHGKLARIIPDRSDMLTDRLDEIPKYNFDNIPTNLRDNPDQAELFDKLSQYVIPMRLEPNWVVSARAIRSWLHKSVTSYVLSEWFSLVLPNKAGDYLTKSDKALDEVNRACGTTTLNMSFRI